MPEKTERRIALFLDFENLVTNTGLSASNFDLQAPMDRLLEKGKVVFRRAYCDWSRFRDATRTLHDHGVELIDVPPSTRAGKNGADMRLVIDALELCYARESIDTFVIASGDSDFCPLAYKLRENGRTVIGLAVRDSTSPLFVKACDEFIYLTGRAGEGGRRGGGSSRRGGGRERERGEKDKAEAGSSAKGSEKGGEKEKSSKGQVPRHVRDVVANLLARATGPLNPSIIKETLVRKEPDFDPRDYGFSTFVKLLGALERDGLLKMQQLKGKQWYVLPGEHMPDSKHDAESSSGHDEPEGSAGAEDDEESYPDPEDDL
ncbi:MULTISPECIES: NYN domain-containing protein [Myxococcaceae]|uniref:NYN domain-containing protein n=1 Tax=Myxococcaceae TaxID=31 RepID=UPI001E30E177|nr:MULTISPECIES: NYN domain-containing protein [Myxococcaceae]